MTMMSGMAMAGERLVLDDSKTMEAEVSNEMVFCSSTGYGLAELKINIKALDGWTILDHSNSRFGDSTLPCMTAGRCGRGSFKGPWVEDVIQNNPRIETIVVKRKLFEIRELELNEFDVQVCSRSLREELETNIGGLAFRHKRVGQKEEFPAAFCILK